MLNVKVVAWALGIWSAITFVICVLYGVVRPETLTLLALISLNVSSGMSRAEMIWGHSLLGPGGAVAAAVWWISFLILMSALIGGAGVVGAPDVGLLDHRRDQRCASEER